MLVDGKCHSDCCRFEVNKTIMNVNITNQFDLLVRKRYSISVLHGPVTELLREVLCYNQQIGQFKFDPSFAMTNPSSRTRQPQSIYLLVSVGK